MPSESPSSETAVLRGAGVDEAGTYSTGGAEAAHAARAASPVSQTATSWFIAERAIARGDD